MLPDLSDSVTAAKSLLGWTLIHHTPKGDIGGIIIETEAYDQNDEASHSFKGLTKRTAPMFKEAGTLYMYFIYGMHWCINIVTGPSGHGEAVLIRALLPTVGIDLMKKNRNVDNLKRLTNGPGSLVQALGLSPSYSGKYITQTSLELKPPDQIVQNILTSPRIGISKAIDKHWRFSIEI